MFLASNDQLIFSQRVRPILVLSPDWVQNDTELDITNEFGERPEWTASVPITMEEHKLKAKIILTSGDRREVPRGPIPIMVGKTYQVLPLNPKKLKHRDRICTILKFEEDYEYRGVSVRFQDNNRAGRVEMSDLVPYGWDASTELE